MSTNQLDGTKSESYTTQWGPVSLNYKDGQINWSADIGGRVHAGALPVEHSDLNAAFHQARTQLDTILPTLSHKPDAVPEPAAEAVVTEQLPAKE